METSGKSFLKLLLGKMASKLLTVWFYFLIMWRRIFRSQPAAILKEYMWGVTIRGDTAATEAECGRVRQGPREIWSSEGEYEHFVHICVVHTWTCRSCCYKGTDLTCGLDSSFVRTARGSASVPEKFYSSKFNLRFKVLYFIITNSPVILNNVFFFYVRRWCQVPGAKINFCCGSY